MTKEVEQLVAMYNAGNDEFKSAMIRALTIYAEGTEKQKAILDPVASGKMRWPQIVETIERAEAAK